MLDQHLTRPQGEALAVMQAATKPGMAHWALSGPEGALCHQCKHWATAPNSRYRRSNGVLCARRCRQFTKMNRANLGGAGPAVEPDTQACKYFGAAKIAPALRLGGKLEQPGLLQKKIRAPRVKR